MFCIYSITNVISYFFCIFSLHNNNCDQKVIILWLLHQVRICRCAPGRFSPDGWWRQVEGFSVTNAPFRTLDAFVLHWCEHRESVWEPHMRSTHTDQHKHTHIWSPGVSNNGDNDIWIPVHNPKPLDTNAFIYINVEKLFYGSALCTEIFRAMFIVSVSATHI